MIGHTGLQDGTSGLIASAASAHHLGDQGKGSLIAAEIPGIQRLVHGQDAYQRHVWKIQSLSDHLRSQHDVILSAAELVEPFLIGIPGHGGVGIHPENTGIRHNGFQFLLQPLCAESHFPQMLTAAGRTVRHHFLGMSAVMAHQAVIDLVICHRNAAIGTVHRLIAGGTADDRMIAPAVQQQQRLVPGVQILSERLCQRFRKHPVISGSFLFLHIHDLHLRQRCLVIPLFHFQ